MGGGGKQQTAELSSLRCNPPAIATLSESGRNPARRHAEAQSHGGAVALDSEVRWPIMKMLADGRKLSISEAAAAIGRDRDGVSRQLKVLREAGVVEVYAGEDRRQTIYQLPACSVPSLG